MDKQRTRDHFVVVLMINHVCEIPAKRYILYALIPDKWFERDAEIGHVYSSHTQFWINSHTKEG